MRQVQTVDNEAIEAKRSTEGGKQNRTLSYIGIHTGYAYRLQGQYSSDVNEKQFREVMTLLKFICIDDTSQQ